MAKTEFTVVIDAGHGGKDVGAIDNNIREKDVNLGVALRLMKYIKKKDKDIKVVMTRSKDEYLTLQKRADIANEAKADLFISIHTNSLDLKNPKRQTIEGASTYTLGLHKDKDNMDVAHRENSVMAYESNYTTRYDGFDPNSDESYIIFEMAQKANYAQSFKFAEAVQKQMTSVADRKDRGVKQAGFWVLWATSMPSVLIELDFITNPKVAEFLGSDKGQDKLAKAIGNATISYFESLRKERRNGKKNQAKNEAENNETLTQGDVVVLASTPGETQIKQESAPQMQQCQGKTTTTTRRRRNVKSREKSENREYEVAVIGESRDYIVESQPTKVSTTENIAAEEEQTVAANDKSSKDKENKKDKKNNNKVNKRDSQADSKKKKSDKELKETTRQSESNKQLASDKSQSSSKANKYIAQATASSVASNKSENPTAKVNSESGTSTKKQKNSKKSGNSAVRIEKKKVVYSIQILASEEYLRTNNPRFCGLSPIACKKYDNIYKYTYGETSDKKEIEKMLVSVKKKIPDAFVITITQYE